MDIADYAVVVGSTSMDTDARYTVGPVLLLMNYGFLCVRGAIMLCTTHGSSGFHMGTFVIKWDGAVFHPWKSFICARYRASVHCCCCRSLWQFLNPHPPPQYLNTQLLCMHPMYILVLFISMNINCWFMFHTREKLFLSDCFSTAWGTI